VIDLFPAAEGPLQAWLNRRRTAVAGRVYCVEQVCRGTAQARARIAEGADDLAVLVRDEGIEALARAVAGERWPDAVRALEMARADAPTALWLLSEWRGGSFLALVGGYGLLRRSK
jgi:hypothetical protein